MSNEIAIIKRESVELIASSAPVAYNENQVSRQRCVAAGEEILSAIQHEGMTDELDQRAAAYIEKARRTVAKMNDKRAPVTKLFDEIRRQFTTMEADVDPSKKDSVPYRLQQLRNEYAAKKRAEEERRRRAAIIEQQRAASLAKYRADVRDEYRRIANKLLNDALNRLSDIFMRATLDNIDAVGMDIESFRTEISESSFLPGCSMVALPQNVEHDVLTAACTEEVSKVLREAREHYADAVTERKHQLLQILPSKRSELERAAAASAEEAERIKREMQEREAAEAARLEKERQEREAREAAAAQMQQQQNEMASLFDGASASVQTYQPKTSVKKKISILNPEGFLPVLMMWWQEEGCTLSVEELSKTFKKQLTFCEKLANAKDGARFIEDESVCYEDEVKAK